jgi:hypothetical protein
VPVRAVTPRVPALHGLVHSHDCPGDCCNWDAAQDLRATGEDIFSSDWPDKPLRPKPTASTSVASLITPLAANPERLDNASGSLRPAAPESLSSGSGAKAEPSDVSGARRSPGPA